MMNPTSETNQIGVEVISMNDSTSCSTTVVDRTAVLLSCTACGPVGVYLCGSDVAILSHLADHEAGR